MIFFLPLQSGILERQKNKAAGQKIKAVFTCSIQPFVPGTFLQGLALCLLLSGSRKSPRRKDNPNLGLPGLGIEFQIYVVFTT